MDYCHVRNDIVVSASSFSRALFANVCPFSSVGDASPDLCLDRHGSLFLSSSTVHPCRLRPILTAYREIVTVATPRLSFIALLAPKFTCPAATIARSFSGWHGCSRTMGTASNFPKSATMSSEDSSRQVCSTKPLCRCCLSPRFRPQIGERS